MGGIKVIRILHIVGAMNRGGAETLIMELYRHMDRTKVQFDFLVYNYSDQPGVYDEEILRLGGKIYSAKKRFYKGPIAFCRELKKFFDQHPEYRIIHAHQYATSGYMLAMAKKSNQCITIAHSHIAFPKTDLLRGLADMMGKRLLKKYANYYFGCSEDALVALSGKKSDNYRKFVMKNAIDTKKFRYSSLLREIWRRKLGVDTNTVVWGNVARFTYQKNHEFLVRTFAESEKNNENCLLVLLGVGGKEQEIKELVDSLGLSRKVIFMGSRGDVNEIINAFDLFVMPSRYEGLGIVLIEAQANGLPCIISADVIPAEADVGSGLVTRMSLNQSPAEWAQVCMKIRRERLPADLAQNAVKDAGYDISTVAEWLKNFYLMHWNE